MFIPRTEYFERIKPYLGKPIIKAITGLRRSGKSIFVRQLIAHLRERGLPEENIIYIDFESLEYDYIRDYRALNEYILHKSGGVTGKIYIFIDEIQDIEEWERAVASWSGENERYDVTITGSNSTMFSGELATKLTGRYIEFPIYPLSLREFGQFYPEFTTDAMRLERYMRYGGMPGLRILDELNDDTVFPYLRSIHDSIVLKDIVRRKSIRNTAQFAKICKFSYDNISNPISSTRISAFLKSQHVSIGVQSVINYLEGLVESQLFCAVSRYDLKGKQILEVNEKYYVADIGLRNSQIGIKSDDISYLIENLVFLELRRRFDYIYTGTINKYEVDFVAIKNAKPHYYQVTMNLDDPQTVEREKRSLLAIADNYPKTIISYAPVTGDGIDGIETISLSDFLMQG
jgi:uncharacterized protein